MNNNAEYKRELETAHVALTDLKTRGNDALGGTWADLEKEVFTTEEISNSNLRVALVGEIIKARKERGISQKKLEEMSGVKQPIIARMESGSTSPNIDTVLKLLAALGKTLYIGDMKKS